MSRQPFAASTDLVGGLQVTGHRNAPTLIWASEAVIHRDLSGRYWTPYPLYNSQIAAIREQFGPLRLSVRCEPRNATDSEAIWLEDAAVSVSPLPRYRGVAGFVRSLPSLCRQIHREMRSADALTVRLPGPIGSIHALSAMLQGKPFSIHMVGDPDEVLKSEGFSFYEKLLCRPLVWLTRWLCKRAAACAYVTDELLQRRYPAGRGVPTVAISNVVLQQEDFVSQPLTAPRDPARLCFCGSLEQHYKGLDILLDALVILCDANVPVRLNVLGSGRYLSYYEGGAGPRGLSDTVKFHGSIPRDRVLSLFRDSDMFIMPSRTEGLPRAMIEAMAQGLPCIGTNIGGIPELLDEAALVPVDDATALAERIEAFLSSPRLYAEQSARNLSRSRHFQIDRIDKRRRDFHAALFAAMDQRNQK